MVLKLRIKSPTSSRVFAGSNLAESPRAILSVQVNLLRVLGSISRLSHPIHLPPLRDRMEDIPILLNTFVYHYRD
jgi:DNA-binding NtrC family response regulator